MLTVNEAFEILKTEKITNSAQMVRRWLRQGKLKGHRSENRKDGWRIDEKELKQFIAARAPVSDEELIHLKQQNTILKSELELLQAENKELKHKLSNITHGNMKKELTHHEVITIWHNAIKNLGEEEDILDAAYGSLIKGVLDNETGITKLHNPKFKRPYLCPFTNKKFGSPERLIKSAIPWLIDVMRLRKKRKQEKQILINS